jgi:addiction module RelE/StbE family toxin
MWTIREHRSLAKAVEKAPAQIRKKYELWKNIARHSGSEGLSKIPGFNDEALGGEWRGFRSSRLSLGYRVIYRTEREDLIVNVERVSKHDYRK